MCCHFRTITEDQLEELFGKFGRIVQKNILKDKITGLPRGVAFVRFVRRGAGAFCKCSYVAANLRPVLNGYVLLRRIFFRTDRYDRKTEAAAAVNEMNGCRPEGCIEPLIVKIAEEHGKQKAAYYAGWHAGYTQSRGKRVRL